MTEIGIIFERVKIVPRVIEILNSIARYSEISLGICFKSEIEEGKGVNACIKTLLLQHSKLPSACMQNVQGKPPLTLPEMDRTHGSPPASAYRFEQRLYKMDREETHVQVFQKLSYFMMYPAF